MIESEEFRRKLGKLIEDFNIKPNKNSSSIAVYWNGLNIMRWAATVCILIYLKDFNSLQICSLFVLSVLIQIFIIKGKPFEKT